MEPQSGSELNFATSGKFFIILHKPQLAENIGMAARAMANCGFFDMRLVSPRCGWPNEVANLTSAEKLDLLNISVFDNLPDALSDLNCVFATTARNRYMIKETYSPESMVSFANDFDGKIGILFGPENSGLSNEELSICNHLVSIPTVGFQSYNLAQAVLIICYTLMNKSPKNSLHLGKTSMATNQDISNFVNTLEQILNNSGHFKIEEKRELMMQTVKNFFLRATPTKQEINSLYGVIKSLSKSAIN